MPRHWKKYAFFVGVTLGLAQQAQAAGTYAQAQPLISENRSFPSREEIANMTTAERRELGPRAFSADQLEPNADSPPAQGTQQQQQQAPMAAEETKKTPAASRPSQEEIDNMTTTERRALGAWAFADPEPEGSKNGANKSEAPAPEDADNMTTSERREAQQQAFRDAKAAAKLAKTTPVKKTKPARPPEPTFRDPSKRALAESLALFAGLLFVLWLGAWRIIKKSKARPAPFNL